VEIPETIQTGTPAIASDTEVNGEYSGDVFVYTTKDLSKSTLRRLNDIFTFLLEENTKKTDAYKSPKSIIRVLDKEGNNLMVTEYKFPIDSFLSLVRYMGV
jgi:hypothetical protein